MLSRTGATAVILAALVMSAAVPRLPALLAALGGAELPAALSALLVMLLTGTAAWVLLCCGIGLLRGSAGRVGRALVPAVFFTAALAAPAHASDGATWPLDGLRLPERTPVAAATPASTPPERDRTVVVQAGDSLWTLARADLGPAASTESVAQHVQRWHERNRTLIGPDPDLLHPGQRLSVPSTQDPR